jgi:PilZ domain-containing protein
MAPANTRRWQRHQVKIPVRIITINDDVSRIAIPGLTTEISRGGMSVYGGVSLKPGDLMEVEFQTPGLPRVAGAVRDRNGYCFGLEFATLLPGEETEIDASAAGGNGRLSELNIRTADRNAVELVPAADENFALFLQRHEAYLEQKELEIKRMRQQLREIRQSRKEIDLLQRKFFGRSD